VHTLTVGLAFIAATSLLTAMHVSSVARSDPPAAVGGGGGRSPGDTGLV
jgi:hypothetical protein